MEAERSGPAAPSTPRKARPAVARRFHTEPLPQPSVPVAHSDGDAFVAVTPLPPRQSWVAPYFQSIRAFWLSLGTGATLQVMQASADSARAQRRHKRAHTAAASSSHLAAGDDADSIVSGPSSPERWRGPQPPPPPPSTPPPRPASPTATDEPASPTRSPDRLLPSPQPHRPPPPIPSSGVRRPPAAFSSARRLDFAADADDTDVVVIVAPALVAGASVSELPPPRPRPRPAAQPASHDDVDALSRWALVSRVPFSLTVFLLLYILFQLVDVAIDAAAVSDHTKANVLAACQHAEAAASIVASLPHTASVAANQAIVDASVTAVNQTLAAIDGLGTLVASLLDQLILNRVNTFLCSTSVFTSAANVLLVWYSTTFAASIDVQLANFASVLNDAGTTLQTDINAAGGVINNFIGGYNAFIQDIDAIFPFLNLPTLDVALPVVELPRVPSLEIPVGTIPPLADPRATLDALVTTYLANLTAQSSLGAIARSSGRLVPLTALGAAPAAVNVTFCDAWSFAPWDAAVASFQTAVAIAVAVVVVGIVVALAGAAAHTLWQDHLHQRSSRRGGGTGGTSPIAHDSEDTAAAGRRRVWRTALARYVAYPPALACIGVGLLGIAVMEGLAAATWAIKRDYAAAAEPAAAAFAVSAAEAVNAQVYAVGAEWAADANAAIAEWEAGADASLRAVRDALGVRGAFQASAAADVTQTLSALSQPTSNATVDTTTANLPSGLLSCTSDLFEVPIPDLAVLLPASIHLPRVTALDVLYIDASAQAARAVAIVDRSSDVLALIAHRFERHARFYYAATIYSGVGLLAFGCIHATLSTCRWRRRHTGDTKT